MERTVRGFFLTLSPSLSTISCYYSVYYNHPWLRPWLFEKSVGHSQSFFFKNYFMYVSTLSLSSDTVEEGIGSHYRWLWATMWLLGVELRTSGRAVSALNHWAISPALVQGTLILCINGPYVYKQWHWQLHHGIFFYNHSCLWLFVSISYWGQRMN